jgi:hypothetical protein
MNRVSGTALILAGCAALWMLRRTAASRRLRAADAMRRQPASDRPRAVPGPAPNLSAVAKGMAELGTHPISPGGGSRGHMSRARRRDATS